MEKFNEVHKSLSAINDEIRKVCPPESFSGQTSSESYQVFNQQLLQLKLSFEALQNLPESVVTQFNKVFSESSLGNLRSFYLEMPSEEFMTLQNDLTTLQLTLKHHIIHEENTEKDKSAIDGSYSEDTVQDTFTDPHENRVSPTFSGNAGQNLSTSGHANLSSNNTYDRKPRSSDVKSTSTSPTTSSQPVSSNTDDVQIGKRANSDNLGLVDPIFVQLITRDLTSTTSPLSVFTVVMKDGKRLEKSTLAATNAQDDFLKLLEKIDLHQVFIWLNCLTTSNSDKVLIINDLLYKIHGGITVQSNKSVPQVLHKELVVNERILEDQLDAYFESLKVRLRVEEKRQLVLERFIYCEFIRYHQSYSHVDSLSTKTLSQQRLLDLTSINASIDDHGSDLPQGSRVTVLPCSVESETERLEAERVAESSRLARQRELDAKRAEDERKAREAKALEAKRLAEEQRLAACQTAREEYSYALTVAVDDLYECVSKQGFTATFLQGKMAKMCVQQLLQSGEFDRVLAAIELMDQNFAFLQVDSQDLNRSSNVPEFFIVGDQDVPEHVRAKIHEIRIMFRLLYEYFLRVMAVSYLDSQGETSPDPTTVDQLTSDLIRSGYTARKTYYEHRLSGLSGDPVRELLEHSVTLRHQYTVNLSRLDAGIQQLSSPTSFHGKPADPQSVGVASTKLRIHPTLLKPPSDSPAPTTSAFGEGLDQIQPFNMVKIADRLTTVPSDGRDDSPDLAFTPDRPPPAAVDHAVDVFGSVLLRVHHVFKSLHLHELPLERYESFVIGSNSAQLLQSLARQANNVLFQAPGNPSVTDMSDLLDKSIGAEINPRHRDGFLHLLRLITAPSFQGMTFDPYGDDADGADEEEKDNGQACDSDEHGQNVTFVHDTSDMTVDDDDLCALEQLCSTHGNDLDTLFSELVTVAAYVHSGAPPSAFKLRIKTVLLNFARLAHAAFQLYLWNRSLVADGFEGKDGYTDWERPGEHEFDVHVFVDVITCCINDYLSTRNGMARMAKPFQVRSQQPYFQSAQAFLKKGLGDQSWYVAMRNVLSHIVHNSKLTRIDFQPKEFDFNAAKKRHGWVYQSLANICVVRCQGGYLGFSCCHGSAVTVYGHSYCCEECNNFKSPTRHLKKWTPELQNVVRETGQQAIKSPDLRFYLNSEAVRFRSNALICLRELSRSPIPPPDELKAQFEARLCTTHFLDPVNALLSHEEDLHHSNQELVKLFEDTIPYHKLNPTSGLSDNTYAFVLECLLCFHQALTRLTTSLDDGDCTKSKAIRLLRRVLRTDDQLQASLRLLELFNLRQPGVNLFSNLKPRVELFSNQCRRNTIGSMLNTWRFHQVDRSHARDRVYYFLGRINSCTSPGGDGDGDDSSSSDDDDDDNDSHRDGPSGGSGGDGGNGSGDPNGNGSNNDDRDDDDDGGYEPHYGDDDEDDTVSQTAIGERSPATDTNRLRSRVSQAEKQKADGQSAVYMKGLDNTPTMKNTETGTDAKPLWSTIKAFTTECQERVDLLRRDHDTVSQYYTFENWLAKVNHHIEVLGYRIVPPSNGESHAKKFFKDLPLPTEQLCPKGQRHTWTTYDYVQYKSLMKLVTHDMWLVMTATPDYLKELEDMVKPYSSVKEYPDGTLERRQYDWVYGTDRHGRNVTLQAYARFVHGAMGEWVSNLFKHLSLYSADGLCQIAQDYDQNGPMINVLSLHHYLDLIAEQSNKSDDVQQVQFHYLKQFADFKLNDLGSLPMTRNLRSLHRISRHAAAFGSSEHLEDGYSTTVKKFIDVFGRFVTFNEKRTVSSTEKPLLTHLIKMWKNVIASVAKHTKAVDRDHKLQYECDEGNSSNPAVPNLQHHWLNTFQGLFYSLKEVEMNLKAHEAVRTLFKVTNSVRAALGQAKFSSPTPSSSKNASNDESGSKKKDKKESKSSESGGKKSEARRSTAFFKDKSTSIKLPEIKKDKVFNINGVVLDDSLDSYNCKQRAQIFGLLNRKANLMCKHAALEAVNAINVAEGLKPISVAFNGPHVFTNQVCWKCGEAGHVRYQCSAPSETAKGKAAYEAANARARQYQANYERNKGKGQGKGNTSGKGKGKGKGDYGASVNALHLSSGGISSSGPGDPPVPPSQPSVNADNTLRAIPENSSEVLHEVDHELDISTTLSQPLSYAAVCNIRNPRESDEGYPASKPATKKVTFSQKQQELLAEGRRKRDALKKKTNVTSLKPPPPPKRAKESDKRNAVHVREADRKDFPYTEQTLAATLGEWDQIQQDQLKACRQKELSSGSAAQVGFCQAGDDDCASDGYGGESDYPSSSDDESGCDDPVHNQYLVLLDSDSDDDEDDEPGPALCRGESVAPDGQVAELSHTVSRSFPVYSRPKYFVNVEVLRNKHSSLGSFSPTSVWVNPKVTMGKLKQLVLDKIGYDGDRSDLQSTCTIRNGRSLGSADFGKVFGGEDNAHLTVRDFGSQLVVYVGLGNLLPGGSSAINDLEKLIGSDSDGDLGGDVAGNSGTAVYTASVAPSGSNRGSSNPARSSTQCHKCRKFGHDAIRCPHPTLYIGFGGEVITDRNRGEIQNSLTHRLSQYQDGICGIKTARVGSPKSEFRIMYLTCYDKGEYRAFKNGTCPVTLTLRDGRVIELLVCTHMQDAQRYRPKRSDQHRHSSSSSQGMTDRRDVYDAKRYTGVGYSGGAGGSAGKEGFFGVSHSEDKPVAVRNDAVNQSAPTVFQDVSASLEDESKSQPMVDSGNFMLAGPEAQLKYIFSEKCDPVCEGRQSQLEFLCNIVSQKPTRNLTSKEGRHFTGAHGDKLLETAMKVSQEESSSSQEPLAAHPLVQPLKDLVDRLAVNVSTETELDQRGIIIQTELTRRKCTVKSDEDMNIAPKHLTGMKLATDLAVQSRHGFELQTSLPVTGTSASVITKLLTTLATKCQVAFVLWEKVFQRVLDFHDPPRPTMNRKVSVERKDGIPGVKFTIDFLDKALKSDKSFPPFATMQSYLHSEVLLCCYEQGDDGVLTLNPTGEMLNSAYHGCLVNLVRKSSTEEDVWYFLASLDDLCMRSAQQLSRLCDRLVTARASGGLSCEDDQIMYQPVLVSAGGLVNSFYQSQLHNKLVHYFAPDILEPGRHTVMLKQFLQLKYYRKVALNLALDVINLHATPVMLRRDESTIRIDPDVYHFCSDALRLAQDTASLLATIARDQSYSEEDFAPKPPLSQGFIDSMVKNHSKVCHYVFDALQSAIRLHRISTGENIAVPSSETLYEISVALALNIDSSKAVLKTGSVYDPTFDSKAFPAVLASLKAELVDRDVATTIEERDPTDYRQQLVQLTQQLFQQRVPTDVTASSSQSSGVGGIGVAVGSAESAGPPSAGVPSDMVQDAWYSMPTLTPLFDSPPIPFKTTRTNVFDKLHGRVRELRIPSYHKVTLDNDEPAQICLETKLNAATSQGHLRTISKSVHRNVLHRRMKMCFPNGDSPCSKCAASLPSHKNPLTSSAVTDKDSDDFTGADVATHTCWDDACKGEIQTGGSRAALHLNDLAGLMLCLVCRKIHPEQMKIVNDTYGKNHNATTGVKVHLVCPLTHQSIPMYLTSATRKDQDSGHKIPSEYQKFTNLFAPYHKQKGKPSDGLHGKFGSRIGHVTEDPQQPAIHAFNAELWCPACFNFGHSDCSLLRRAKTAAQAWVTSSTGSQRFNGQYTNDGYLDHILNHVLPPVIKAGSPEPVKLSQRLPNREQQKELGPVDNAESYFSSRNSCNDSSLNGSRHRHDRDDEYGRRYSGSGSSSKYEMKGRKRSASQYDSGSSSSRSQSRNTKSRSRSCQLSEKSEWLLPESVLRSLYLNHSDQFWTAEWLSCSAELGWSSYPLTPFVLGETTETEEHDIDVRDISIESIITLNVLANFMSSEVQPRGLPFDRGRRKKLIGQNHYVTSSSTPELLSRYGFSRLAGVDRDFCPSTSVRHKPLHLSTQWAVDQLNVLAVQGYSMYIGLDPADTLRLTHELLSDVQASAAGLHGWANFCLNNGENLVPHGGFRADTPTSDSLDANLESHATDPDPTSSHSDGADYDSTLAIAKLGFCDFHGRPLNGATDEEVAHSNAGVKSWYNYWLANDANLEPDTQYELDQLSGCTPEYYDGTQSFCCPSHESGHCSRSVGVSGSDDDSDGVPDCEFCVDDEELDCDHAWSDPEVTEEEPWGCSDFVGLRDSLNTPYDGLGHRLVHVNAVHQSNRSLNSKHLDTYSEPVHYDVRKPARRTGKWVRNPQSAVHRRTSRPMKGFEAGLPWPEMASRTRASDGSIMLVLDSGAEASVFKDLELIPSPVNVTLPIVSFNGSSSCCNQSGECITAVKDVAGGDMYLNLGYAGYLPDAVKDNLASIPTLRKIGYQFWLGDYPYMITPLGVEIPLYVGASGYLGLRVHSTVDAAFDPQPLVQTRAKQVGFLSNDYSLWHSRFCHQAEELLARMNTDTITHGLPKLYRYKRRRKCLCCGMGKSTNAHVGPVNHADVKHNDADLLEQEEYHDSDYYPMQQLHLDCCEMDAPDLYGNVHFLVIVDRATGMMWDIPLKDKRNLYKVVDHFIKRVVKPFHEHRHYKLAKGIADGQFVPVPGEPKPSFSGLRTIRCDRGTEFNNEQFKSMLASHGAALDMVPAYVNDGRAEAAIKKLVVLTRCCLIDAGLKKCFWSSIMSMVCHVVNRTYNRRRKAIPYTLMTGLKPVVSHFRQPGCIALCHKQDKYRQKLDDTAFIGITIGYDTSEKSWIFLNPKSGRTVRSIHARFYERSRDPQELIDMSHLVLDDPKWLNDVKVKSWRCQLWPRQLWPGMPAEKLGDTSQEFPDVQLGPDRPGADGPFDFTTLDYNLTKSDRPSQQSVDGHAPSSPEQDNPNDVTQEDMEVLRHAHDLSETVVGGDLFSGHVIHHGVKYDSIRAGYIRARIDKLVSMRLEDVFNDVNGKCRGKVMVNNSKGEATLYKKADLLYDLKTGYIQLLPSSALPEPEEGKEDVADAPVVNVNAIRSDSEFFGERVETTGLFDDEQFDNYCLGTPPDEYEPFSQISNAYAVSHVETDELELAAQVFDAYYGAEKSEHTSQRKMPAKTAIHTNAVDSLAALETCVRPTVTYVCSNQVPESAYGQQANCPVASFKVATHGGHSKTLHGRPRTGDAAQFYDKRSLPHIDSVPPDSNYHHRSKVFDSTEDYGDMPEEDELNGYRGDGTFVDKTGRVRPTHIVRRSMAEWQTSFKKAVADGRRHVMGVPSSAEINQLGIPEQPSSTSDKVPIHVPKGTKRALFDSKYYPHWPEAIYKELIGLAKMGCMELIAENDPLVRKTGVIPSHIVFTDKWTADVPPRFLKCKGRVVAGGNWEPVPENVFEHFSPTAGPVINRYFDAYCVCRGYKMYSSDCVQAFLNAKVPDNKPIFVRPPPHIAPRGYVWRLRRQLYGLKTSPRAWAETLTQALVKLGFVAFGDDPCFMRREDDDGEEIVVEIFVDDVKWGGKNEEKIRAVIKRLHDEHFPMTCEGQVSTYLGMKYVHGVDDEGYVTLEVNQTTYIEQLMERFKLTDLTYHQVGKAKFTTPLPVNTSDEDLEKKMSEGIESDEGLKKWAAEFSFPTIIGSVIHAMVHTRPDIAYAVSVLSRHMAQPKLWVYRAARHLLLYLSKTKHLGIQYSQQKMLQHEKLVSAAVDEDGNIMDKVLHAAVDASFADCSKTYRSTSGYVVWFGGSPIEWECKRQSIVTLSTMEAEYVAASKCVCSIKFLHKLCNFVKLRRTGPTQVAEDNAACVAISTKPVHRQRSRFIGVKYANVREGCLNGVCTLVQTPTKLQCADLFTKQIPGPDFVRFREVLMGYVPYADMVERYNDQHKDAAKVGSVNFGTFTDRNLLTFRDCIMGHVPVSIPGYDSVASAV